MSSEPKQLNRAEWAEAMLAASRREKEALCLQHGGPYDLQPLIHAVDEQGHSYVGLIPDRDYTWIAVRELRKEAQADFAYIGVCADAYMREYPAGATAPEVQRGEIARQFGLGDFTVTEQLIVSVIDVKTDEITMLHLPYTIGDAGMPEFGEPVESTESGGAQVKELRKAARRSRS